MFDKVMEEDGMMQAKSSKVDELLQLLLEGMGDELKGRYKPAPSVEEDSELQLQEGQDMAGKAPGLEQAEEGMSGAETGGEPSDEELEKVLMMVMGGG